MGFKAWFSNLFKSAGYKEISTVIDRPAKPKALVNGGYFGTSSGAKWIYGLSATGVSPIIDHYLTRQNARSAYHETPQAKALVDRYADNVVDIGLKLEPSPQTDLLGIAPEAGEEWSRKVESLFHLWANDKRSNREEILTFYQLQRLVEISQQRDNDYFVRLYFSPRKDLLNPLQLQLLDPNQIRGCGYTSTYGFNDAPSGNSDGITRDSSGKEIAYNVYVRDEKGVFVSKEIKAYGPKSGRQFMVHGFAPEYAGQGRGYSRITHILQDFENLTDFTLAQIKKAINQSNITMYVEPSDESDSSQPFADMSSRYSGVAPASVFGAEPSEAPEGETVTSIEDLIGFTELPEATFLRPGSVGVFNLKKGEKLRPFEATSPAESYDKFVNAFVSNLAASVSMPIEVLLMKFEQNYSASRAALIMFWRIAMIWREELAADFLNPVYKAWLSGEIAAGRIQAPGWTDPRLQAAWLKCNWIGSPMPNIDPMRTAKADKEYIEMGAQTLDRVARNLNGSDGATNRQKLNREFQDLPIPPWTRKNEGSGGTIDEDNS